MEQQQRDGLADDIASSNDHGAGARNLNVAAPEQLDDARRRARHQLRAILDEPPDVHRCDAIDILCWIDRIEDPWHCAGPERVGQRYPRHWPK